MDDLCNQESTLARKNNPFEIVQEIRDKVRNSELEEFNRN